jgi:hypothetical protein
MDSIQERALFSGAPISLFPDYHNSAVASINDLHRSGVMPSDGKNDRERAEMYDLGASGSTGADVHRRRNPA